MLYDYFSVLCYISVKGRKSSHLVTYLFRKNGFLKTESKRDGDLFSIHRTIFQMFYLLLTIQDSKVSLVLL